MNPLLDKDFLKELDNFNSKEIYARITALTVNEFPIETIEGKVTSGNVNLDGASAVRRTCSISLIAQDVNINNFYWGLNNKIKLEIGLKNFINKKYSDIIWFPLGIYIITGFNTSINANGYNISISGKDKMCLLNGEVGGQLPSSVDFGVEEYYEDDMVYYNKIPIKNIIREMLHTYASEPYHNIIINDIDDKGLELLEYRGDSPLYLFYNIEQGIYNQVSFDGDKKCILPNGEETKISENIKYNPRIDDLKSNETEVTKIKFSENGDEYSISKVEFGQTVGYRLTDLTYPGDLIAAIGESVTSILDKIVQMLGNFEYFYDLYGRFIFQSKKTYINTNWSPIIKTDEDMYVENSAFIDSNIYNFEGNNLIQSFSNNPDINNIKNDYSIWGARKGVSGAEIPIHFRYAIHKKPEYYKNCNGISYYSYENLDIPSGERNVFDWREIIYQMATDYYQNNQKDDFHVQISQNNPEHYPTGITGYEQFYADLQGFWRQLYDPNPGPSYYDYSYGTEDNKYFTPKNENEERIDELYINEDYIQISNLSEKEKEEIDRKEVYVVKKFEPEKEEEDPYYELHKLIDTIVINYEFDEDGKQEKYYITADTESGYKPIEKSFKDKLEKKEIYVKDENNKYKHILDTVNLDNSNYYLKKALDNNEYKKVSELPSSIKRLYYIKGKGHAKYYTISSLDLEGKLDKEKTKQRNYLKYYVERYDYYGEDDGQDNRYWHKDNLENPDVLNYWIEFLDSSDNNDTSELDAFSILAIGNRSKVVNDTSVKSIYYRDVPNLIFVEDINKEFDKDKSGYVFIQIPDNGEMNYFNISAQGKSAKEALDELLYEHTYFTESINITAIPIYYLEPNTRISVYDESSKINGEYIISRISLPLTYNGQMNIQATKAPQRFN